VGTWQANTWPVLSEVSDHPTSRPVWVTGRAMTKAVPSYELHGCGYSPSSTVKIFVNKPTQRLSLGTATANASGCFTKLTGTIGSTFWINDVVTFEIEEGSHFAVVGLPRTFDQCWADDSDFGTESYYMVDRTDKTTWCVEPAWWKLHQAELLDFDLDFPDKAYAQLEDDFGIPYPNLPFKVQVGPWKDKDGMTQTGCNLAHTGTDFGPGVFVSEDCFFQQRTASNGQPTWAPGGYIFLTQEIVNNYTGGIAGIWPTDWWADHRSPFPTMVNWNLLAETGLPDVALINFDDNHGPPSPDNVPGWGWIWDPQADMFQGLKDGCAAPACKGTAAYGTWGGFATMFQLLKADGIVLHDLKDPPNYTTQTTWVSGNPSALLSNYVVAYMSLGHGANLASLVDANGVGERPEVYIGGSLADCWRINGGCDPADGNVSAPWSDYTVSPVQVTAIADAHCQIESVENAGGNPDTITNARARLRLGDYAGAISTLGTVGACGNACPSECGCYQNQCAAPWY
jgi:hypothetical protein